MYGMHTPAMATILPVSIGTLLTVGWLLTACMTIFFLIVALIQLARPVGAVRP